MARAGILAEDEPVELLEGLLVKKMTIHPPHTFAVEALRDLLPTLLPPGWFANAQQPTTTTDSEPEPDGYVARGARRDYVAQGRHPGPQDLALVIEAADSSLAQDQTVKLRIYAAAGIAVYWIVNLIDRRVQVYTSPTGPAAEPTYRTRQDFGHADEVPLVIEGREVGRIPVRDLLP
jgi:Uma2 family endonuclease